MFSRPGGFLQQLQNHLILRLSTVGLTCLFFLMVGTLASSQESAQQIDRTRTFLQVNAVKKMTFQYHKEKPRQPAAEFAKFKHKGGFYDETDWKRKGRWQRKLRMRETCAGKLREVEHVHNIQGEGTVVTVIRGKNFEKYWVGWFRSQTLLGIGTRDSRSTVISKLGKPYRQTRSVLAYACLEFGAEAGAGGGKYDECLRIYFSEGDVIAAKYFLTLDCQAESSRPKALFALADDLKKMNAAFNRATLGEEKGFRKYPFFAFMVKFKDDQPKAKRKVGTVDLCDEQMPVVESLYSTEGGKGAVILSRGNKEEVYWVGRFKSNKLKGVATGDTRRRVIRKLGVPFQRTSYALAYACKDWEAAEYDQKTVYKTCLKVFFKKGKAIGAFYSHNLTC